MIAALTQLDVSCRAPVDKAAILVSAHKILVGVYFRYAILSGPFILYFVDGLSRLPPIKLKPEEEIYEEVTFRKLPSYRRYIHIADTLFFAA